MNAGETSPTPPPTAKAAPAWLVWSVAAAAFVLAAFCLASLTWDGSYCLLQTLQDGAPFIPHRRWFHAVVLEPLLWARPLARHPLDLAVLHGLLYAAVPLASLAVALRMLRGKDAPLRYWALLGMLLVPLPGQMVMVAEVSPAMQLGWVCLAFVWRGCPPRWAWVAALSVLAIWGLHPIGAALFAGAAATALSLGCAAKDRASRRRLGIWTALFGLAALAKAADVALFASAYEKANLHATAWMAECHSGLLRTPALLLLPVLADAGLRPSPRVSKMLWGAAFAVGIAFSIPPEGWAGSLCYRKFGIVFTLPVALLAGIEALRHQNGHALPHRSLLRPALLFAVVMAGMSLSWRALWKPLPDRLAAHPGSVVPASELIPPGLGGNALQHWSLTSLSLLLQGWAPEKVAVWDPQLQLANGRFCICPQEAFPWEDRALKLGWIGKTMCLTLR